jgi:hypothetical protein
MPSTLALAGGRPVAHLVTSFETLHDLHALAPVTADAPTGRGGVG